MLSVFDGPLPMPTFELGLEKGARKKLFVAWQFNLRCITSVPDLCVFFAKFATEGRERTATPKDEFGFALQTF